MAEPCSLRMSGEAAARSDGLQLPQVDAARKWPSVHGLFFFLLSPSAKRTARGLGYLPACLANELEIILATRLITELSS